MMLMNESMYDIWLKMKSLLTKKPECHSRTCCGVKPDRLDNSVTSASDKALPRLARASLLPIDLVLLY